ADIDGAPRDLAGLRVGEEGGDDEFALGKGGDWAEVDGAPSLPEERRQNREARSRERNTERDQAAERERRPLEQPATREALHVDGVLVRRGLSRRFLAGFEDAVPDEPVVGAVELSAQRERDPVAAVAVDDGAVELAVEHDRAGNALDRQLTGKSEVAVVAVELHPGRLEADFGVSLGVE